MNRNIDLLFSEYVIDGAVMESTPADMLKECMSPQDWERLFAGRHSSGESVIDESADRNPVPFRYDYDKIPDYLDSITGPLKELQGKPFPVNLSHAHTSARILVAESILSAIWKTGHFRLEELSVAISCLWDTAPVGNMAAFYAVIEAASEYIFDLGLRICDFEFKEEEGKHDVKFKAFCPPSAGAQHIPDTVTDGEDSVLLYIPFDTCSHKLGGSLLGEVLGGGDEVGPDIMDPDYFIDCYEVVHELVEDGVVLSGVNVGRGGLLPSVDRILGDGHCINLDIKGIERAYIESDSVRILFAEIPGAVIQVRTGEMDYIDSQFLLQDIAYYPIGQPISRDETIEGRRKISLISDNKTDLARVLAALMSGQSSEGED